MSGPGPAAPNDAMTESDRVRELGRRRVNLFVGAILLFAVVGLLFEESDHWTYLLDDVVLVVVGLVLVVLLSAWSSRTSLPELRRQNNLATILLLVALVFQLAALPIEVGDPADFGNDPPLLIILVIALLNRYIP